MDLYILRHGIAESGGARPDAERALTDEGREKLHRVLERAAQAGVSASLILSSPLKRAIQTAEIAGELLGYKDKIAYTDALLPEAEPADLWRELRARRSERAILIAGHEPMLSAATSFLLGASDLRVDFKKGALVHLEIDGFGAHPQGILKWMLTAKLAGG